ncbi:MAG: hypothetical protein ACRENS_00765 [Candidatus Eiseniibacteriota bacterium]
MALLAAYIGSAVGLMVLAEPHWQPRALNPLAQVGTLIASIVIPGPNLVLLLTLVAVWLYATRRAGPWILLGVSVGFGVAAYLGVRMWSTG